MKKSLLALALIAGFSSAAFASESNVQLYGIADVGFQHYGGGQLGGVNQLGSGLESASRIGIKGQQNLGNGNQAFFDLETGFCANGGTTANGGLATSPGDYCTGGGFMGRLAEVGLKGDWGTAKAGRLYNPLFLDAASVDPFGTGMTGSTFNMVFPTSDVRFSQTIQYTTPNYEGLHGDLSYSFGNMPNSTSNGSVYALDAVYRNGPWMGGVGYMKDNTIKLSGLTSANAANKTVEAFGSYDFQVAKVSAYVSQNKADFVNANSTIGTGVGSTDSRTYMLGLTAPVGPGNILASVSRYQNRSVSDLGATQVAIGYTYNLSKDINLYTSYAHIKNDSKQTFSVGNNTYTGYAPLPGGSSNGFDVGMRYMF